MSSTSVAVKNQCVDRTLKQMDAVKASTLPKRKFGKKDGVAATKAAHQMLLQQIEELEHQAMGIGLIITARALNNAKNAWRREMERVR